jgi:uncharacterized protein (UPF0147 family)
VDESSGNSLAGSNHPTSRPIPQTTPYNEASVKRPDLGDSLESINQLLEILKNNPKDIKIVRQQVTDARDQFNNSKQKSYFLSAFVPFLDEKVDPFMAIHACCIVLEV